MNQTLTQIQEEFDEKFMMFDSETGEKIDNINGLIPTHKTIKDLKSFLTQSNLRVLEKVKEIVESKRKIEQDKPCNHQDPKNGVVCSASGAKLLVYDDILSELSLIEQK